MIASPLVYPDGCSISVAAVSCSEYWSNRVDYWNDVYGVFMIYYRVECHYNVMLSHCARLVIAFNLNFQAYSQKVALYLHMLQLELCNNLDNKIISKR